MKIGDRIRLLRRRQFYSISEIARQMEISQGFLSDIELNNKPISIENLSKFCDVIDISLSDFFKDENCTLKYILTSKQKELIEIVTQLKDEEIDCIIERIKVSKRL
jgi:transcriptional regulator with XRE-family HTH domain